MTKRITVIFTLMVFLSGCATMADPWRAADRTSGGRFIPVELWSGAKWNGQRDLTMAQTNFTFGKRDKKRITGPVAWRHPATGQNLKVYERLNKTTKGDKRQLFTLNPTKTGLAKVFDHRPGQKDRYQSDNAVLFPLGLWKKGELRNYRFEEFVNGKKVQRTATIRMRRLSFTYKGVKHAMKYDWILKDAKGKILFHERYIYGPQKGLMYYKDRLKKKK